MKRALLPLRVASMISMGLQTHSNPQLQHCFLTKLTGRSRTSARNEDCDCSHQRCMDIMLCDDKTSIHAADTGQLKHTSDS